MKLVLVDDHRIVIEGIRLMLEGNHDVAGLFTDPNEALGFFRREDAEVLITDFEMPGMNGIELFRKVRGARPRLKGILLTMHDESAVVRQALKEGFSGFLLKNVSRQELNLALEKVKQGHTYVSAELTPKLVTEKEGLSLSEREQQVLKLIIKENTNKQIADALFLSERTVETYRKNLYRKANTNNLVGLVKFAYANKLVE